jgi:signal transduction histidine kinase
MNDFFQNLRYIVRSTLPRLGIFSITKKIAALMLITYIGFIAVLYLYYATVLKPTLMENEQHTLEAISEYIYPDVDVGINFSARETLENLRTKIIAHDNVAELYIATDRFSVGQPKPFSKTQITFNKKAKHPYFALYTPCRDGYYVLYYDADTYLNKLSYLQNISLVVVAALAFVLLAVAMLLKLLLLPMTRVSEIIRSRGNLTKEQLPSIASKDERGDLLRAIALFLDRQRKDEKRLMELNANLEENVRQKTRELRLLNANLEQRVREEVAKNRENEKILHEQSRFAAMGEMLGNVAHQWRQPLSSINAAIGNAKIENMLSLSTKESLDDTFMRIETYTRYLSDTIDDFRSYFKKNVECVNYKVTDIIKTVESLSRASFKDITVIKEIELPQTELIGYPNEVMQVLLNILNNAKDAFDESDVINKYILIQVTQMPEEVVFNIYDNAGGIDKKIIGSIFDPYFTTKHKAQGTGIGLYMSKEMIQKHMDGELTASNREFTVDDSIQFGACFTIRLPRASSD